MVTIPYLDHSWARRLGKALATPFDPEDYLALFNPLHSARETRAQVRRVIRETDQAVTLELRPNRRWRGHQAGQHTLLGVEIDGVRQQRCFSLSSAPSDPYPCVSIKANGQGGVSDHLVRHAKAGDLLVLGDAQGDFVLPEALPTRLLLVTAGSGITPVHSIVKALLASNRGPDLLWFHFERRRQDLMLADSLRQCRADPRLDFRLMVTGEQAGDGVSVARLDEQWLTDQQQETGARPLFACGPAGFLDTVIGWHGRHGRAPLFHERFQSTPLSGGEGGQVSFARSGGQRRAQGELSLLEVAEQAGLKPKHGCRMGICHTCKCRVNHGRVRDLHSGESRLLSNQEIRICMHAADGDVEMDL